MPRKNMSKFWFAASSFAHARPAGVGGAASTPEHTALSASWAPRCLCLVLFLMLLAGCGLKRPEYTAPTGTSVTARRVVEHAYSQIGTRYRSGGASPRKGFDCSGLVHWAYNRSGVTVPRITRDQARTGKLVGAKTSLQPADILVFKNGRGPNGLHTGLYIGHGRFIHSPRAGQRVRTENLDASYWKNTYIGARRVIK